MFSMKNETEDTASASASSAQTQQAGTVLASKDGVVLERCIPLGVVMDERICSGHYFSQFFAYIKELLNDPHLMETRPE